MLAVHQGDVPPVLCTTTYDYEVKGQEVNQAKS